MKLLILGGLMDWLQKISPNRRTGLFLPTVLLLVEGPGLLQLLLLSLLASFPGIAHLLSPGLGLITKPSLLAGMMGTRITYLNCFCLSFSTFFLWMYSISTRLFLNTLPFAFMYRSWYRCRSIFLFSRYFFNSRRRTRIRLIHRTFTGIRALAVPFRFPGPV